MKKGNGYYAVLKDEIVEVLQEYRLEFNKQRGCDMQPRDYDNWIGGFVVGMTMNKEELRKDIEGDIEILQNLIENINNSDIVKEIGVSGTASEVYREIVDDSHTNEIYLQLLGY